MNRREAFEEAYKIHGGKPKGSGEYLRSEAIWQAACKYQIEKDAGICEENGRKLAKLDYGQYLGTTDCAESIRNQEDK